MIAVILAAGLSTRLLSLIKKIEISFGKYSRSNIVKYS